MQIQRIQTVWLLLAFVAALVSLFFPWFIIDGGGIKITENVPLLVLAILAAALPFVAIFLFKNMRRQKLVARMSALFAVFAIGYALALTWFGPDKDVVKLCVLSTVCMALSGLFDCLAVNGIAHDEQLLKAADRLR